MEKYGEDKPVKRKHLTDGGTTKQTTKRQKATPLLEQDQNVGTAEIKSVAQTQKKGDKSSGRIICQSKAGNADIHGR